MTDDPRAHGAQGAQGQAGHDCDFHDPRGVAGWRIQRATTEIDGEVDHVNLDRELAYMRRDGWLAGSLDATRDRRLNRTGMLGDILTATPDELDRAREQGDHTLVEQAHAAARLTDRLPQPLHRAADVAHLHFHVQEQAERTLGRRLWELNRTAAKTTGRGKGRGEAAPSRQAQWQAERQAEQVAKQRAQTRAQLEAVRNLIRDQRAAGAAIAQRTQQLRDLDQAHHRTLTRGQAALKVLGERGHPTDYEHNGVRVDGVLDTKTGRVRLGPWDRIITQPSREEEAPHTLGGTGTVQALAAENARDRDGRPDAARREQAVRDRAQLAEMTRQLDPDPSPAPAPRSARQRPGRTRQPPAAITDRAARRERAANGDRDGHGDDRGARERQQRRSGRRDPGRRRDRSDGDGDGGRDR